MRYEFHNNFRKRRLPSLKANNNNINNSNRKVSNILVGSPNPRFSRNVGSEIAMKDNQYRFLSYNSENKKNNILRQEINDDQDNNDIYKNVVNYKSPLAHNSYMKNNIFQTVILDIKNGNKNNNEKNSNPINRNINIINNIIINDNNINHKNYDYVKSINNERKNNNLITIEINDNNKKSESNKNLEFFSNSHKLDSDLGEKTDELIQIGDKSLTLEKLKRKIRKSDCQLFRNKSKILKIIQSNNYCLDNQKNSSNKNLIKNIIIKKELVNSYTSFDNEPNSLVKDFPPLHLSQEKSLSNLRSEEIKKFHLSFVPLLNGNEEEIKRNFKNKINHINNDKDKNNNSLKMNKSNNSKDIKKNHKNNIFMLNKNKSFDSKNKKNILHKILVKHKAISKKNIYVNNKNSKIGKDEYFGDNSCKKCYINNVGFSINDINYTNTNKKLPSIFLGKINVSESNEIKNGKFFDQKELMPEIIKNFYEDKKMKGYASIIPNKESNTLFLRKFHKKYNQSEQKQ
jgi:hypothetical protein